MVMLLNVIASTSSDGAGAVDMVEHNDSATDDTAICCVTVVPGRSAEPTTAQ